MPEPLFLHEHPYGPFIPENATKLIIGTLPPPRFSTGELHEEDVDFCYGSRDGQLWRIIDRIFDLNLKFENTPEAVAQRRAFLTRYNIGICDVVASCERAKIDASDVGMQNVQLRDVVGCLKQHSSIQTLLFTGGNSKNGPEYFFRRHLRDYGLRLIPVSEETPRIHRFILDGRTITTVSLTAPSGSANRAVGSNPLYKALKKENPSFTTVDFRIRQYEAFLKG